MIEVGEAAPEFTLPRDGEGDITLSALQGNPVVLYFYPKDDTTGCTKEACDFREAYSAFQKLGVEVIGVSPDPVKKHDKFKAKYDLPFPLFRTKRKLSFRNMVFGLRRACTAGSIWALNALLS